MNFKCNFCSRMIHHRLWGEPEIKCVCGAKYTKTITVEIKENQNAKRT